MCVITFELIPQLLSITYVRVVGKRKYYDKMLSAFEVSSSVLSFVLEFYYLK